MIKLNLISPEQKRLIKTKQTYLLIKNISGLFLVLVIIISILLILTYNSLNILYNLNPNTKASLNFDEQEIEKINSELSGIEMMQTNFTVWSDIILVLTQQIPENIQIKSLEIDNKETKVELSGFAEYRDDYLNMINTLKSNERVSNLKSPLENLLSKEDINFSITFNYLIAY